MIGATMKLEMLSCAMPLDEAIVVVCWSCAPTVEASCCSGRAESTSFRIAGNKTRQGYALRSTLKPAGYFFLQHAR